MRPLFRVLLSVGAIAAFLAPAFPRAAAETTLSDSGSGALLPPSTFLGDSGLGSGMWIPPTELPGFASARLFDGYGHLRYTMRASLLPVLPGPPNMDQQGGFVGQLFAVDANGNKSELGQVSGKWIRHPSGEGEFDVEVLVWSGDRNQPLLSIGSIQGVLGPLRILPVEGDGAVITPSGEIVLMWSIPGR